MNNRKQEMYVIAGATGNTGKAIALGLLAAGKQVRAIGRDREKLQELVDKGADAAVGTLDDAEFLTTAFQGATGVYALVPPKFSAEDFRAYQNSIINAVATAFVRAGVTHAVTLSSIGAHLTEKAGVVQGLHDMEQRLNAIPGLNVLHLRPTYFMENTLGQIGAIKGMGMMGSPINGELAFPMVATKDIGTVGVQRLLNLNFTGSSHQYILGPRDVSYNEVAALYGKKIGKEDLAYVQFSMEDGKNIMMNDWGLSPSLADAFVEFMQSANEGKIFEDAVRTTENSSPTTLEEFSETFRHVYNQS